MPARRASSLRRLSRQGLALGVTRLARITGLDRAGVEVAAAIRPGGHVLQVSTGKGETLDEAARGALSEAAELDAAERPGPLLHATAGELRALVPAARVLEPSVLAPGSAQPWWRDLRLGWCAGVDLLTGVRCFVPAHAVHCPPPGGAPLGAAVVPWTSSGLAAHPDRDAALLHGLLELVERDQLEAAFPGGFRPRALAERLLSRAGLARAAPRTASWVERLEARGFSVHLLDATGGLGIATAAALLVDRERGAVPVAAGYACRPGRDEALLAALLEAAQSRLTEIHGAREDVEHGARESAWPLAERCARLRPERRATALPDRRAGSPRAALRWLLGRLARGGLGPVVACDLASAGRLAVVRLLVPGLRRSRLLG